ncbi:MAG: 2-phospho-L-lactate guanylyltransferase [Marmoricola sp.]
MTSTVLLVPVKAWPRAKTRLRVAGVRSPALAASFAADALAAAVEARRVAEVVVVTDVPDLRPAGVTVLGDRGRGDLNAALRAAAEEVRRRRPDAAVAAMCADLPCLRAEDLDDALTEATGRRAFVADADGTGTTLLVAAPGDVLDPHFGRHSALAHRASGAVEISAPLATLRRDVDTDTDLHQALVLGVGPSTRSALAAASAGSTAST